MAAVLTEQVPAPAVLPRKLIAHITMLRRRFLENAFYFFVVLMVVSIIGTSLWLPEHTFPPPTNYSRSLAIKSPRWSRLGGSGFKAEEHQLSKRELSWDDAVAKGCRLVSLMAANANDAPQSGFTSAEELVSNGWIRNSNSYVQFDGVSSVTQALNLHPGNNQNIEWVQDKSSENLESEGIQPAGAFSATGGSYNNYYNANDRIIYGSVNWSPKALSNEVSPGDPPLTIPPLAQWSDVVFLEWNAQTGGNPGNLDKVWRMSIANGDTYNIALQALGRKYNEGFSAVGRTFLMSEDEGKAILATPNGSGVAWLLINHKAQMGLKKVVGVYVFQADNAIEPVYVNEPISEEKPPIHLIFYIG